MYVQIFAKSDDNPDSSGKNSWFNTGDKTPLMQVRTTRPKYLDSPEWHVEMKSADWRELRTGNQGGKVLSNNYTLTIELTPTDLAAIVTFAFNNKLVEIVSAKHS